MPIRLIQTTTLHLESFMFGVPKYAILSHTWDHGQEISFQEMEALSEDHEHPALEKQGYKKIEKTCRLAKYDGLDYAWVDTCCVDKKSSAELSENINSMYRYYQKAEKCYVWLNDFNINENPRTRKRLEAIEKHSKTKLDLNWTKADKLGLKGLRKCRWLAEAGACKSFSLRSMLNSMTITGSISDLKKRLVMFYRA